MKIAVANRDRRNYDDPREMRSYLAIHAVRALGVLLGAWVASPLPAAMPGFPLISAFTAEEIGAEAPSWSVVQDASGILHFGAKDLVTFDGDRWRSTPMNGAHAIRGLDFSSDGGRLWAGAVGEVGWFERTPAGGWHYRSLAAMVPAEDRNFGNVWHVFAEANGAVFVADEKLMRWDGKTMRIWRMPRPRRLRALRVGATVFLQQPGGGVYRMGASGPEPFLAQTDLGDRGIFWLEPRGAEWLLVANDGLFMLAGTKLRPIQPEASDLIRNLSPTHVTRLADGRLAVGTVRGGIILLRRSGALDGTIGESDGLPSRMINGLFVDRDQQLWATSFTHVSRISVSSPSRVFDQRASLPRKPFHRISGNDSTILAATDDSVFRLNQGSRHFTPDASLQEPVADIRASGDGFVVAGFRAIKSVNTGATTLLHATTFDSFAVSLPSDDPSRLLVADGRRIVEIGPGREPAILVSGLPDNAWSMARDRQGRIWLGTQTNGVLFAEPSETGPVLARPASELVPPAPAMGPGIVRTGIDGTVYLFSSTGAWAVSASNPNQITPIAKYPHRSLVEASEATDDGKIWLIHSGAGLAPCIGAITTEDGRPIWSSHSVEGLASIGAPQSIFAQLVGAKTTVLWIGGTSGILRHEVAHGLSAPPPRPPLLRAVARTSENDLPHAITGPLPFSTRSIEFEFAEPDFTRRSALRLQTRFLGVDRDWMPADATARQTLTAVRDGQYVFQVRAVAETGVASAPTTFTFEVLPPWWRTMPAIVGAVLALIPLGYGSYRLRVRALRGRNAELEEKVRHRTEELERASAAKTQFVANMSHDIRNPLNGIVGLALALEDTKLERRQREIVATLRECTTYLSTLVDDVLDFASIEAGRVELRPRPFVPHELLRSIVTTVKADTAERGAVLLVEADPSLPASVMGDAGRIQQILVNYVSNALKYAGGHIRLSASVPSDPPSEIEFSVTDEGPGITEAEKAALFTKFSRLSQARREDIPGSGLGLASCRLLADIMGGSVGVESEPGQGARFYVRLPLTIVPPAPEISAPDLPNTTVLVVEDMDYNAWAAAAVLSKLGLTCERARTGAEAIRLFGERRFNVVLIDRNLPDMDGTEVARRMRQMESDGCQAVLLAVTAYCTAEDRAVCLEAGMDAFVGKPLTPEKLRKVLITTGRRQLAAASVHIPPDLPSPEINLSLLRYLATGSAEGLGAEIKRYLAALEEIQAQLKERAQSADHPGLAKVAHSLVGHAKLIDATILVDAAANLEIAAGAANRAAVDEALHWVERASRSIRAELHHPRSVAQSV